MRCGVVGVPSCGSSAALEILGTRENVPGVIIFIPILIQKTSRYHMND